jgi:hypothetical protein
MSNVELTKHGPSFSITSGFTHMTGPAMLALAIGAAKITSGSRINKLKDSALSFIFFFSFSPFMFGKYLTIFYIFKLTGIIFYTSFTAKTQPKAHHLP